MRLGAARYGTAVEEWYGDFRPGKVRSGMARRLRFGEAGVAVRCGLVWHGGWGMARRGASRRGASRLG